MSETSAIPDDLRKSGVSIAKTIASKAMIGDYLSVGYAGELIACALAFERLAERERQRERDARIAANHPGVNYEAGGRIKWRLASQHEIAAAIRSQQEPET